MLKDYREDRRRPISPQPLPRIAHDGAAEGTRPLPLQPLMDTPAMLSGEEDERRLQVLLAEDVPASHSDGGGELQARQYRRRMPSALTGSWQIVHMSS